MSTIEGVGYERVQQVMEENRLEGSSVSRKAQTGPGLGTHLGTKVGLIITFGVSSSSSSESSSSPESVSYSDSSPVLAPRGGTGAEPGFRKVGRAVGGASDSSSDVDSIGHERGKRNEFV